jgi:hypothetical protein
MGSAKSEAKTAAARENGKKGGRPRKDAFRPDGSYPVQPSNKDIYGIETGKTSVFSALTELDVYDLFVIRRGDSILSKDGILLSFPAAAAARPHTQPGDKVLRWSKVPKFLR